MCVYIYIHIYISIYIYTYICISDIYIYIHTYTHVPTLDMLLGDPISVDFHRSCQDVLTSPILLRMKTKASHLTMSVRYSEMGKIIIC